MSGSSPSRSAAISLSRAVRRSASRRELANTIVERCWPIRSATWFSTWGQIEAAARLSASSSPESSYGAGAVMSSTGTTTLRSHCLADGGATIATGVLPPRNRATSSSGRTVADRPIRCAGAGSSASSRSRLSPRWAPRLVPATACTSSTMTVSTWRRLSRAWLVSIRKSDSGVVIRMSGGVRTRVRRSAAGVSPDRMPTVTAGSRAPRRSPVCRMPISGDRRLRSTSTARALRGET